MVDHSTAFIRAYSSALMQYTVALEMDHVDHTTTTTVVKIGVTKVDLTAGMQRILLYQHIKQFV